jgi:hypothetical protein
MNECLECGGGRMAVQVSFATVLHQEYQCVCLDTSCGHTQPWDLEKTDHGVKLGSRQEGEN